MSYCTKCGNELKEGAKFCVFCGEKLLQNPQPSTAIEEQHAAASVVDDKVETSVGDLQATNRRVYWDIQSGQVARVIKSSELEQFKDVKGVVISEGTTAHVRVNGKTILVLDGGVYDFKQAKSDAKATGISAAWNFLKGIFSSKKQTTPEEEKALIENPIKYKTYDNCQYKEQNSIPYYLSGIRIRIFKTDNKGQHDNTDNIIDDCRT